MKLIKETAIIFLVLTAITGLIYPLAMTGIGQIFFHHQANGSIIEQSGRKIGSELIGQEFNQPGYFWSRPSATGGVSYNAAASSGSNLGPSNPALLNAVKTRIDKLKLADPEQNGPIPVDLVTASGSGLDPDISPAAAEFQLERVAKARSIQVDELRQMVKQQIAYRQFGVLGESRINVVKLNPLLDKIYPIQNNESSHAG
jgi:K+-transporting ATPase ATPase C chain